jgi:hypothetical protein
VLLTSFEYFFYHFFNLPIRVQLSSIGNSGNNSPVDSVYPVLLEDYLAHLLPIDPLRQSKLFSQDIHVHQVRHRPFIGQKPYIKTVVYSGWIIGLSTRTFFSA